MSAEVVHRNAGHPSFRQDIFQRYEIPSAARRNVGKEESDRKLGTLYEACGHIASRVRPQLDASAQEVLDNIRSATDVLDAIADERLRFMPENGSQLDRAFKQAVVLVGRLEQLARLMATFTSGTEQAIRLTGGSCLLLLQVRIRGSGTWTYKTLFWTSLPSIRNRIVALQKQSRPPAVQSRYSAGTCCRIRRAMRAHLLSQCALLPKGPRLLQAPRCIGFAVKVQFSD